MLICVHLRLIKVEKTKPITRPLGGNPKSEYLNPKRVERVHLKKQSQNFKGQNDVKSILTMVYGDFDEPDRRKNKAKQTQFI